MEADADVEQMNDDEQRQAAKAALGVEQGGESDA